MKQGRHFKLTLLLIAQSLMTAASVVSSAQTSHKSSASDEAWRVAWRKNWIAEHSRGGPNDKPQTTENKTTGSRQAQQTVGSATAGTTTTNSAAAGTSAGRTAPTGVSTPTPLAVLPPANLQSNIANPKSQIANPKSSAVNPAVLSQTRPDLFPADASGLGSTKAGDHTQDNSFAPVGDAWKMLAYLLPMLLIILGCLNLLKRFHARTGRLPGVLQSSTRYGSDRQRPSIPRPGVLSALLSSLQKNTAHTTSVGNIRLIESVPVGEANVHLLEVRGRVLLLGATAGSLNLLAEFDAQSGVESDDFRNLLHAAAADMDALDYTQPDMPTNTTVTALEDLMRDTSQAVAQRARRLRTVREVEGEDV